MSANETAAPSADDRDPIDLLAESFITRFRSGERPSIDEYALKYPELAEEIRSILPALVELELNHSPDGTATGPVESLLGECPGAAPKILGDYMILREIGRGGMGVVYEAVQQSLGRHVALKVLPQQNLAGSSHLERFQLEARAAARLHHTNIVPVFGVGSQDGVHYYAMQFIQGQGLDEVFEELRRLKGNQPAKVEPATSQTVAARSLTHVTTRGLLTGLFESGKAEVESGPPGVTVAAGDPATTQAELSAEAHKSSRSPVSSRSSVSGRSGISAHAELSGTQVETQYYRSVARVGMQVAEGLAYAHSQGIVHRDIKPSNLLLDAQGTVWITDFGLAKAEGSDALTHTGDIVGTLRYMAPERFDGWSDPRSDVYSVGVTLYELLTLQYLFQEPNRAKLVESVMHVAPASPRKLDKKVPRDLETIILKAIAKEPAERYATAEQMAHDLERFLADKPVLARRASPTEQAWRWCRRNPALAATSALAIAGLMVAVVVLAISNARIGLTSQALAKALRDKDGALKKTLESETLAKTSATDALGQRARAEAGEAQARAAVDEFLTRVTEDQLLKAPGSQTLRRELLQSALRFYDEFLKEHRDDPSLMASLAGVHLRVGSIHSDLGEKRKSRKAYQAARALFDKLAKANPEDRTILAGVATCQFRLSDFLPAIAIWEKLIVADPTNSRFRRDLADAFNSLAIQQGVEKKLVDQLKSHQKALALRERLAHDDPENLEYRMALGATLNNLGVILAEREHPVDGLAMYLRAVEHEEAAFAKAPFDVLCARYLGTSYLNVARTQAGLGRTQEAERWFKKSVDHAKRITRDHPSVPSLRAELYQAYEGLARLLIQQGRKTESAEAFRQAASVLDEMPRRTPGDWYDLACLQARAAAGSGEKEAALSAEAKAERARLIEAAMRSLARSVDGGPQAAEHIRTDPDLEILHGRADFQALVAQKKAAEEATSLARRGESGSPEEKLKVQRDVLEARAKLAKDQPRSLQHRADLAAAQYAVGQVLGDLDRFDEARKTLDDALAVRTALVQEAADRIRYQLDVGWTHLALGVVHWKAFELAAADREWKAGLNAMETALYDEPEDSAGWKELNKARIDVADKLVQIGIWDEAQELLDLAFRRNPASLADRDGHDWYVLAMLKMRAGDQAGFRATCAEFFKHFQNFDRKFNVYRACLIGPSALDDIKVLIPFVDADLDRKSDDDWSNQWSNFLATMIHFRAGELARAQEIMKLRPDMWGNGMNASYRALVELQSGNIDAARRSIERYVQFEDEEMLSRIEDTKNPRSVWFLDAVLMRETIRREVQTRLDGKPGAAPPLLEIYRGRSLARMGRDEKAEKVFAAARASRPNDTKVMSAYAQVLADLGDNSQAGAGHGRSLALVDRAIASHPGEAAILRARAVLHARHGEWDKSKADLDSSFQASPTTALPWFVAGTWVVGPYPSNGPNTQVEIDRSLPPEDYPDPGRTVTGLDGKTSLAWKPATPKPDGQLDLTPFLQSVDRASVYVLTRVYAPESRVAIALLANDDWLRFWCNGTLVRAQPLLLPPLMPVPIRLCAGWNTLLAKVVNSTGPASLTLKLSNNPDEIARAFVALADKTAWSNELASLLETCYSIVPDRRAGWDNNAESLAAEVAKRDAVYNHVIASRPRDSLLLQERGRYLAWLEKWDESLAAYDAMIQDHPDPEDAFVEYASIMLLKGDRPRYQKWVAHLSDKFAETKGPFVGTMLARACGLSPESKIDAARLIKWSEQATAKPPTTASGLHCMGLALLRAGRLDEAIPQFQASIDAGDDSARNWYGLALAHIRRGRLDSSNQWLDKAESWIDQTESEFADRTTHPSPPIYITNWLETLVLRGEAAALLENRRLGDVVLIDRSALAGQQFRLPLGAVDLRRDRRKIVNRGSMTLSVPFRTKTPFANGTIGPDEYGPPLEIDFRGDANPGRVVKGGKPVVDPGDLSAELFLAYTRTDLFIAVRVRDDKLVATQTSFIPHGDTVEIYVDGDRQANDFSGKPNEIKANREGFQLGTGFTRQRYANGVSFKDYAVAAAKLEGGYVIEYRIPLETIDIDDGAEINAPGPGSTLKFNLGIVDNDEAGDRQDRYAVLWNNDPSSSPFHQGEAGWTVDLHLAHPLEYKLVEGPAGATLDSETGVFTWSAPAQPQTANVTIRVQDAEKPELSAQASFTITTRAK